MDRKAFLLLLPIAIACSTSRPAQAPDPAAEAAKAEKNLARQGADAVLWQHSSAEAHRIFQQGYELARIRLAENLQKVKEGVPAVIVDIDETVLDNSPYEIQLQANGKIYDETSWKAWTDRAGAKALPGAVDFLTHAAEQGCEIYYISNRRIAEGPSTLANLKEHGFPFADEEHLLLMDQVSDKTERRRHVSDRHPVVLLVGDQLRDFDERFKDRSENFGKTLVDQYTDTLRQYFVLLPNPMYGTYRDAIQQKGDPKQRYDRMRKFFKKNTY